MGETPPSPWFAFFATPVSGDAKILALRLACEPFKGPEIEPRNIRAFAEELRMAPYELERAFAEIRDPRVGWTTGNQYDRPVLKPDALPRTLIEQRGVEVIEQSSPKPSFDAKAYFKAKQK